MKKSLLLLCALLFCLAGCGNQSKEGVDSEQGYGVNELQEEGNVYSCFGI